MKTRYVWQAVLCLAAIAFPAAAASITTSFAGNNGGSGNMFDATIKATSLVISGFDVNITTGSHVVDVYYKTGSYVGFDTTPAAWTLASSVTVTGLGQGTATHFAVTPFTLAAGGTYGVYVTLDGSSTMVYSNGSSTASNSDLSLSLGDGLVGLFGATSVFANRSWNGTIDYSLATSSVPEPASLTLFALAAPGLFFLRRRYLRKY